MFKKLLLAQIVLCGAMVSAWVYQRMPATELKLGKRKIVLKEAAAPSPTRSDATLVATVPDHDFELAFPVAAHGPEDIISYFGDKRGKTRLHQGIDIKAPRGTAVVAVADGFVERIREGGSGGKQLYLRDGKGRLFYYAHLDDWSTEEFQAVEAGEVLGTVGNTGNASKTTPHLHFEILKGKDRVAEDPASYWIRP